MAGDETRRLQALKEYSILDSGAESPYDDLTQLASLICRTPIAAISLVDNDRQWFKSIIGLSTRQTDREMAFCSYTIRGDTTLVVEDATIDGRFAQNPLVTGDPGIRFYAGTPLINAAGLALGALCVIDTKPRLLLQHEIEALEALGRQAMALLESRRLNEEMQSMARESVARLARTRALHAISSALIEQRDIGDLQQTVVDLIASALPADRVTIFTLDTSKQEITHFRKGGPGSAAVVTVSFAELWDGLTGWVLRSKTPALSPKSSPDSRERPDVQARRKATHCGDIIVVPITYKNRILGTITAINALDGAEFGADHLDLMVAMANQVAIAIQTSNLFADLTHKTIALKAATDRVTLATGAAGMGIWEWDLASNALRWDDQMYRVYHRLRTGETETISFWSETLHPEDRLRTEQAMSDALATSGEIDQEFRILWPTGEIRHLKANARVLRDAAEKPFRMVGVNFDITKRKTAELQLEQDARRDRLTNLANRSLFMERLTKAITRIAQGQQAHFAVYFLDFDRFKLVNDTLGHEAGDDLLRQIASRLRCALRASDTMSSDDIGNVVSRFGGDEFLILINDLKLLRDSHRMAERILAALAPSYRIRGTEVHSSASIGIVTSDLCGGTAEEIVRNADLAMYEAKRAGRACYVLYNDSMHSRLIRQVLIEGQLRAAIGTDQLYVVYQPIIEIDSGRMVSAEALLRWNHPDLGVISPAEFIPIAEDSGLVITLDQWVQVEACRALLGWRRQYPERAPRTVSVNISKAELALGDKFVRQVSETLARTGLPADCLQLEVTEREVMNNPEKVRVVLEQLRAKGVRIAMDDFGTGTSSLGVLRNYVFDCVKIDQSFVRDLTVNREALEVMRATINLIENLNMTSLAEGVEDAGQLDILQSVGCRYAQGHYFSHELPADQLMRFSDDVRDGNKLIREYPNVA